MLASRLSMETRGGKAFWRGERTEVPAADCPTEMPSMPVAPFLSYLAKRTGGPDGWGGARKARQTYLSVGQPNRMSDECGRQRDNRGA